MAPPSIDEGRGLAAEERVGVVVEEARVGLGGADGDGVERPTFSCQNKVCNPLDVELLSSARAWAA